MQLLVACLIVILQSTSWAAPLELNQSAHDDAYNAYYHTPDGAHLEGFHMIKLRDGHSISAHFSVMGIDLSRESSDFRPMDLLSMYRGCFNDTLVHDYIRKDPGVEFVEKEVMLHAEPQPQSTMLLGEEVEEEGYEDDPLLSHNATTLFRRAKSSKPASKGAMTAHEKDAPWNFHFLSMDAPTTRKPARLPLGRGTYYWWENADEDVDSYVLDSGINVNHKGFKGRAKHFPAGMLIQQSLTSNPRPVSAYCRDVPGLNDQTGVDMVVDDLTGHGTAVAGLIAEVADKTAIWNLKVQCGPKHTIVPGSLAEAFLHILQNHNAKLWDKKVWPTWKGSVINLAAAFPLGSNAQQSMGMKAAMMRLSEAGIPLIAGVSDSGNGQAHDPLGYCHIDGVICTGEIDANLERLPGTPQGAAVKVVAPGTDLSVFLHNSNSRYGRAEWHTLSGRYGNLGTASVSGVAAQIVGKKKARGDTTRFTQTFDRYNLDGDTNIGNRPLLLGFQGHFPQVLNNGIVEKKAG